MVMMLALVMDKLRRGSLGGCRRCFVVCRNRARRTVTMRTEEGTFSKQVAAIFKKITEAVNEYLQASCILMRPVVATSILLSLIS